MEEKKLKIALQ